MHDLKYTIVVRNEKTEIVAVYATILGMPVKCSSTLSLKMSCFLNSVILDTAAEMHLRIKCEVSHLVEEPDILIMPFCKPGDLQKQPVWKKVSDNLFELTNVGLNRVKM